MPALLRNPHVTPPQTQALETSDNDILLYRLHQHSNPRLAVISHGLEGSFDSPYVRGMTRALVTSGWDVLTWNMRGCGDMPNRLVTWYHSGKSDDLASIVRFACSLPYASVSLVGFSVGGNITLKYLGEELGSIPDKVRSALVISVPMDLEGSALQLAKRRNAIYMQYLLRPLRRRIREKATRFPGLFDTRGLSRITTFYEFDRRFTAPFHGFSSVGEYWHSSSSLRYLHNLRIPTLALTAIDDPFLSSSCIPVEIAKTHEHLHLEVSKHGGHVGFMRSLNLASVWTEERAVHFLDHH